jgi:hypothetical protein
MLQGFVLFIYGLFNNTTGIPEHRASDNSIITALCTGKGMEGRARGLFCGAILVLSWRDRKKPHETTIRTVGVPAEIRFEPCTSGIEIKFVSAEPNYSINFM